MRLFNKKLVEPSRRTQRRGASGRRPRLEPLENRMLLTCTLRQTAGGELYVIGDDAAEQVAIEDLGHGEVSVLCQDLGGDANPPRLFTGVTSLIVNLAGGDDRFGYLSVQDVNAALPLVEVSLGDGNDVADLVVELHGTPDRPRGFGFVTSSDAGGDVLNTQITTLTSSLTSDQPVVHVEQHGGDGQDVKRFTSATATGGLSVISAELEPSTGGNPDCLIWDLVDGESGAIMGQVLGSDAAETVTVRSGETGIGRAKLDLTVEANGGADTIDVDLVAHESLEEATLNLDGGAGIDDAIDISLRSDAPIPNQVQLEILNAAEESVQFEWEALTLTGALTKDRATGGDLPAGTYLSFAASNVEMLVEGTEGDDAIRLEMSGTGDGSVSQLTAEIHTRGGNDSVDIQQDRSLSWITQQSWKIDLGAGETDQLNFEDNVLATRDRSTTEGGDTYLIIYRLRTSNAASINFRNTLLLSDGTPVRSANVGMLRTIIGAQTDYNYEADDSHATIVANGFDESSVALNGYLTADVSAADADASFSFAGLASGDAAASRFEGRIERRSGSVIALDSSGFEQVDVDIDIVTPDGRLAIETSASNEPCGCVDDMVVVLGFSITIDNAGSEPDIDLALTGFNDATVDVNFFDGRLLSAADLKMETIDVPNLDLNVGIQEDGQQRELVTISKAVEIKDPEVYSSKFEFGLNDGATSYAWVEENVARSRYLYFAKVADVEGHVETSIAPLGDRLFVNRIEAVRDAGETSIAIEGLTGAAATTVKFRGTDPENERKLQLDVETADGGQAVDPVAIHAIVYRNRQPATVALENVTVETGRLVAAGFSGLTRTLSHVEIRDRYAEFIDMDSEDDVPVCESKPLLIMAEDVEAGPGAQFRSDVQGAGHVVRRTQDLTLGDGSSYFESITASADADSADSGKTKQSLYFPEQMLQDVQIGQGASFESRVVGSPNDDFLAQRIENIQVRGAYVGTYNMGAGTDLLSLTARDVVVATGASFHLDVDGEEGRDLIWADIEATVDGHYRFLAAGGNGGDTIGTVHRLAATPPQRGDAEAAASPAIDILLAGDEGKDLLTAWLFAPGIDEDAIQALIDGGPGIDTCGGNVEAINCELAARPIG